MSLKKILSFAAISGLWVTSSVHANPTAKPQSKPKMPHSHHSAQGGEVLMFGDDHVEVKASKAAGELLIYVSDKMRDPVDSRLVKLEVTLVDGEKRSPLHLVPSSAPPYQVAAHYPAGEASAAAKIEIRAPRIVPAKGQVSGTGTQSLPLSKIVKPGAAQKPAHGHEGH